MPSQKKATKVCKACLMLRQCEAGRGVRSCLKGGRRVPKAFWETEGNGCFTRGTAGGDRKERSAASLAQTDRSHPVPGLKSSARPAYVGGCTIEAQHRGGKGVGWEGRKAGVWLHRVQCCFLLRKFWCSCQLHALLPVQIVSPVIGESGSAQRSKMSCLVPFLCAVRKCQAV